MSERASILFVDDEERIVTLMKVIFRGKYDVYGATSGQQALEILHNRSIHVLVSDQRMPGMAGIELLTKARGLSPQTMRILLTGYSDLAAIVGSVNDGEVYRFINKPWNNEVLRTVVGEAAEIAISTGVTAANASVRLKSDATAQQVRTQVLVLDDDDNARHWIGQFLGDGYEAHFATNIPDALKVLARQNIGVLVSDLVVAGQDTTHLLRILKQQYPLIMTVIVSNAADSDSVIKLINQAQIYRFVTKPIRQGVFDLAVRAAAHQHHIYAVSPDMLSRHRVSTNGEPEDVNLVVAIAKSLSSLRARLRSLVGA